MYMFLVLESCVLNVKVIFSLEVFRAWLSQVSVTQENQACSRNKSLNVIFIEVKNVIFLMQWDTVDVV